MGLLIARADGVIGRCDGENAQTWFRCISKMPVGSTSYNCDTFFASGEGDFDPA
jgi:hypothetical protein